LEKTKPLTNLALVALLPSWLALAWLVSKAQWFWNHRPDLQFGWIVLMLCLFLIWDNWAKQPPLDPKFRWPGAIGALLGLVLLFIVQIYQAAFGTMAASVFGMSLAVLLVIFANLHLSYGWAGVRFFVFPFAFILIGLPLPSAIYDPIVTGLQSKVATINVELLRLFGIPAERAGSLIHLPNGTVGIDEACSGIRSLQSTVMATLFIGYLTLKSRALQVVLLLSGAALAIFGNIARSLFLSFTANSRGISSVEKVHDSAGWSILVFTAIGVAFLAWLMAKLEKAAREQMRENQPAEEMSVARS
jgi:exosortase